MLTKKEKKERRKKLNLLILGSIDILG